MLSAVEIMQEYERGQLDSIAAKPPGWSDQNLAQIGHPFIVGCREKGHVGLIQSAKQGIIWSTNESHSDFYDAQRDLFEEANRRKSLS